MLTTPHVTAASFKAHPTFLDLLNLRSGDTVLDDQTDELTNILLMASSMADDYCEFGAGVTLAAHTRIENKRMRPDRYGRLLLTADHFPIVAVQSLGYGSTPSSLTTITNPTTWIEDERRIVADLQSGGTTTWSGSLQFGLPSAGRELYTQWIYIAGYASTALADVASAGATSIKVSGSLGITAGTALRIWDPGNEEPVTVDATYTAGTTIPLTAPLVHSHAPGFGVSAMPPNVHLAVILYACALLQRPDSEDEDTFPSARVKPNTKVSAGHDGSGFISEADHLMSTFRRSTGF